ncbi:MAG: hypothetical protein IT496_12565 [Gammaproteobacteria bacterium]|nr:hypothetical protein [Gammaproteobacteria bacterium]
MCVLAAIAPPSWGQASARYESVQQWLDASIHEAAAFPSLGNGSVSWRLEISDVGPPERVAGLRQQVSGHPDHPMKWQLDAWDRHAKGHPDVMGRRLWSQGPGHFRINYEPLPHDFTDVCVTPEVAWQLSPTTLVVVDPSHGYPQEANLGGQEKLVLNEIGLLLWGGLHLVTVSEMQAGVARLDGEHWEMAAQSRESYQGASVELTYRGRWDRGLGVGFVDSMSITKNPVKKDTVGTVTLLSGWSWDENVAHWIAAKAVERAPSGGVNRTEVLEGSSANPAFQTVVTLPDMKSPDPVRGAPTFKSIMDFRTGIATMPSTDGGVTHARLSAPSPSGGAWRRWAGWLVAAGLVGLLVWIRWGRQS